jgi:ribosomal protein S28E/S33
MIEINDEMWERVIADIVRVGIVREDDILCLLESEREARRLR